MAVTVADIKKDLPNFPDAVIDEWLIYFANEDGMGWPPPVPFGEHRWGRLLGNRPVSWWAKVTWAMEKVDCSTANLSNRAQQLVNQILAEVRGPNADSVTNRRYRHATKYIMDNGVFPKAMTAMRVADGMSFIDGHHRMAAFTDLQKMPPAAFERLKLKKPGLVQEVWIGTHSDGELPNV